MGIQSRIYTIHCTLPYTYRICIRIRIHAKYTSREKLTDNCHSAPNTTFSESPRSEGHSKTCALCVRHGQRKQYTIMRYESV